MYQKLLYLFLSVMFSYNVFAQNINESQPFKKKIISNIKNIEINDYQEISEDNITALYTTNYIIANKEIRWEDNDNVQILSHNTESLIQVIEEEDNFFVTKRFFKMISPNRNYELLILTIDDLYIFLELKDNNRNETIKLPGKKKHSVVYFHLGNWNHSSNSFLYDRHGDIYKFTIPEKENLESDDIEYVELAEGEYPKYSQNGLMIAYIYDDSKLYLMDNKGKNKREVFNAGDRRITNFEWSPEGDKIAFTDVTGHHAKLKVAILEW